MALYRRDLAYVHAAGFESRAAAPERLAVLRRGGIGPGALVVDLGCGSGVWVETLRRAGYRTLGLDASPAMIALARRRVPGATFRRGTIARAALPRCQAVTAFGECFNYRHSRAPSLARPFARVRRALVPGGLFVFDVREPAGDAPSDRLFHTLGRDWAVLVRVRAKGVTLTRSITTFRRVGRAWRRSDELHRLRLFPRDDVLRALRQAGFRARVWPAARRGGATSSRGRPALTRFIARA